MAPRLRGIFFDLYGTLFLPPDAAAAGRVWVDACYRELAARGLREAEPGFRARLLGLGRSPVASEPGLTPFESRIGTVSRELGLALPPCDLRAVADAVCAAWQASLRPDPEAPAALAALAVGHRVRLVSNFDHPRHVRSVLEATGLGRFFDRVIISGEVGVEKPDPGILSLALEDTGMLAADTAYVGDSIVDYAAAAAAGMRPVLIRRPGQVSGDCPDALRARCGDPEAFLAAAAARGDVAVISGLSQLPRLLTSA